MSNVCCRMWIPAGQCPASQTAASFPIPDWFFTWYVPFVTENPALQRYNVLEGMSCCLGWKLNHLSLWFTRCLTDVESCCVSPKCEVFCDATVHWLLLPWAPQCTIAWNCCSPESLSALLQILGSVWEETGIMHVVVLSRGLQSAAVLVLHFLARHHQCGYFNKASFSNRRILIILCSEMRNNHGNLLNHTTVHWLPHAKSHFSFY